MVATSLRSPPTLPGQPPDLIVVSSRLPLTVRRTAAGLTSAAGSGGLVAVLEPLLRDGSARWLGWPGDAPRADGRSEPDREQLVRSWVESGFVAIDLPADVGRAFYEGYANETLWPLLPQLSATGWCSIPNVAGLRAANERFAAGIAARAWTPASLVWVHDFQLMLLPELVRAAAPGAASASSSTCRSRPRASSGCSRSARRCCGACWARTSSGSRPMPTSTSSGGRCSSVVGIESRMDQVEVDGRVVRLGVCPIGIVVEEWTRLLRRASVQQRVDELRQRHAGAAPRRRRRPPRLHEGHPGAPAGLPTAPPRGARASRPGHARPGAVPTRERVPRYRELAARSTSWWQR